MWDLAALLSCASAFAFDTETTGVDPMNVELVGLSFALKEHEAYYIPIPEDQEKAREIVNIFKSALENPKSLKIGQNIKYDYIVLHNYGIHVKGDFFDTMVAHYLLQPEQYHNMDYLANVYLGYEPVSIEKLIGPKGKKQLSMRQVPVRQVCEYAAEDADVTLQLKNRLEKELKTEKMEKLFYDIEMPLTKVLADMEITGVNVDITELKSSSDILTRRMNELEQEIFQLAGVTFNVSSARQVGEVLFERLKIDEKAKKTKTGQYSTTEEILEKLRSRHPIVGKILESKRHSQTIEYLYQCPARIDQSQNGKDTYLRSTRRLPPPDDSVPATRTCRTYLSATTKGGKYAVHSYRIKTAFSSRPTTRK